MLCAQHALNNLMQSPVWYASFRQTHRSSLLIDIILINNTVSILHHRSPQDLAEIARTLDSLERSHLEHDGGTHDNSLQGSSRLEKSSNYDDSGERKPSSVQGNPIMTAV
jgi:hypothetical protein